MDRKIIVLGIVIGLGIPIFYGVALAESLGSNCYDYMVSTGTGMICERVDKVIGKLSQIIKNQDELKEQNEILINQTIYQNKLLEINNCLVKNTFLAQYAFNPVRYLKDTCP